MWGRGQYKFVPKLIREFIIKFQVYRSYNGIYNWIDLRWNKFIVETMLCYVRGIYCEEIAAMGTIKEYTIEEENV